MPPGRQMQKCEELLSFWARVNDDVINIPWPSCVDIARRFDWVLCYDTMRRLAGGQWSTSSSLTALHRSRYKQFTLQTLLLITTSNALFRSSSPKTCVQNRAKISLLSPTNAVIAQLQKQTGAPETLCLLSGYILHISESNFTHSHLDFKKFSQGETTDPAYMGGEGKGKKWEGIKVFIPLKKVQRESTGEWR